MEVPPKHTRVLGLAVLILLLAAPAGTLGQEGGLGLCKIPIDVYPFYQASDYRIQTLPEFLSLSVEEGFIMFARNNSIRLRFREVVYCPDAQRRQCNTFLTPDPVHMNAIASWYREYGRDEKAFLRRFLHEQFEKVHLLVFWGRMRQEELEGETLTFHLKIFDLHNHVVKSKFFDLKAREWRDNRARSMQLIGTQIYQGVEEIHHLMTQGVGE